MAQDEPPDSAEKALIARIDALTAAGRANWFGLLAYLVFTFITVLSVQDADFFIDSRQTQLPLVNISIPTYTFFLFAPVLGAALYIYLHLHIRKVSEALSHSDLINGGAPLERRIKPWLLNDLILRRTHPNAIDRRDLDRFSDFVTILLVWVAGPFVLGALWTNSFVVHDFWLTSLCATSFFATVVVGCVTWCKMEQDTGTTRRYAHAAAPAMYARAVPLFALILLYGLVATKGFTLPFQSHLPSDLRGLLLAARPDLREAQLSALPPDQRDPVVSRAKYRGDWCRRVGHAPLVCGTLPHNRTQTPLFQTGDRIDWCAQRMPPLDEDTCGEYFSQTDREFETEWAGFRAAQIAALPKPDMRNRDIRKADLVQASLTGVNFSGAQMERADLSLAQIEEADLSGAQMKGANLSEAQMERALLVGAQMEGADLREAQIEGADLREAQMEGADLSEARMNGADLSEARMEGALLNFTQLQGADLSEAQMEGALLIGAQMEGADLRFARMVKANWDVPETNANPAQFADLRGGIGLDQARLSSLIGNAATLLPETPEGEQDLYIPSCWAADPPGFEHLVAGQARYGFSADDLRNPKRGYFCAPGDVPRKTGTPWPVYAAPPWGAQDPVDAALRSSAQGADEEVVGRYTVIRIDEALVYRQRMEAWVATQPLGDPID